MIYGANLFLSIGRRLQTKDGSSKACRGSENAAEGSPDRYTGTRLVTDLYTWGSRVDA